MGYTKDEFPKKTVLAWQQILIDAGFEVTLDPPLGDAEELPPGVTPADFRKGSVKRGNEEVTVFPSFSVHQGEKDRFYIYYFCYFLDDPIIRTKTRVARMRAQHALVEDILKALSDASRTQSTRDA